MSAGEGESEGPRWHCFPGGEPPEAVLVGWRMLGGLPPGAVRNLWQLLGAALDDPGNPQNRGLVESFAQRFDAPAAQVLGAVQASDFLLRQGAALDLDETLFRADLERLSGGRGAGVELLLSRYGEVRARLRERLLEQTLADHGNVLVGFDWRVDRVQVSNHGSMGDLSVVLLNLRYRSGGEQKQLALQLPPSAVESFKAFWDQFSAE